MHPNERLARKEIELINDGHLGALDEEIMPAVDCPEPDGLQWDDLVALLRPLLASPLAVGIEVTVFDPDLDPDGSLATTLTRCLIDSFAARPMNPQVG